MTARESLVVERFKRPNVEAPYVVWEYAMTLERWVIDAEERLSRLTEVAVQVAAEAAHGEIMDGSLALLNLVLEEQA